MVARQIKCFMRMKETTTFFSPEMPKKNWTSRKRAKKEEESEMQKKEMISSGANAVKRQNERR